MKPLTFKYGSDVSVEIKAQPGKLPNVVLSTSGPLTFSYEELIKFSDTVLMLMEFTPDKEPHAPLDGVGQSAQSNQVRRRQHDSVASKPKTSKKVKN